MCVVRAGGGGMGIVYFTQGVLVAQEETLPLSSNHIDLLSNGIIWKSGVYTEKRLVFFLELVFVLCFEIGA